MTREIKRYIGREGGERRREKKGIPYLLLLRSFYVKTKQKAQTE